MEKRRSYGEFTMTERNSILALVGDAAGIVTAVRDNNLIAILLIVVLGLALGIGLVCFLLVVHFWRTGRLTHEHNARPTDSFRRTRRFQAPLVDPPSRWLAIRGGNPFLVQAALGLHNPSPCSWEEGLNAAHEHKLFISPPVAGWILVMGSILPEPCDDADKCFFFMLELSRKVGQVQFFSVNRIVNHHAWIWADRGQILRAYVWAGRTLWNQGKPTRAEIDLALKCFDYEEPVERIDFGQAAPTSINTEKVPLLAGRWSFNPSAIDPRLVKSTRGIAGQLFRSRIH